MLNNLQETTQKTVQKTLLSRKILYVFLKNTFSWKIKSWNSVQNLESNVSLEVPYRATPTRSPVWDHTIKGSPHMNFGYAVPQSGITRYLTP